MKLVQCNRASVPCVQIEGAAAEGLTSHCQSVTHRPSYSCAQTVISYTIRPVYTVCVPVLSGGGRSG